ncbi:MAG: serine hydrolase [Cyclobacteriaceae bacterium]|nr:serine hydrolase [Cyclobacteriaceae bacterium]
MKQFLFVTVFVQLLIFEASSQKLNTSKLDSLFSVLAANDRAMGSVAISKNKKVLYSRAIGFSSVEAGPKIVATEKTKYRIGSITKTFTTVLIFQLIEEGKLSLTTTLDKYFPAVQNAKTITISNLLNHRSGIHNFTDDPDYLTWMTMPKSKMEMIAIIAKNKPNFVPDTKAQYSNSNFVLLGFIVEQLRKKSYAQILSDRIVKKVGLTDTYFGKATDLKDNECFSYQWSNNEWKKESETDMSIPHGAGAIVSTPTDLVMFMEALFAGKLVSQSSLLTMKTIVDGYGMGLFQVPFGSKRAFAHTGGIDGFSSNTAYFPEDSLAIAYCTNGQRYPMNDILIGMLSLYYNRAYSIPNFSAPIFLIKASELDQYIGVYSSAQLPLKITITKKDAALTAQATGQASFPLDPVERDKFKFDRAGVILEFTPATGEMILKQGGGVFKFIREK